MKKAIIILITFFSFLVLKGNPDVVKVLGSDYTRLLHKTHAERTVLLTPFYEKGLSELDSTTIFSKIEQIRALSIKENDRELELETYLLDAHYYCYRPKLFSEKEILPKIIKLNEIAKKEKVLWLEIRCQSLLGNYYFSINHNYEKGFEHFSRTNRLLKNVTPENFPLKGICIYQLARAYYEFHDYKKASSLLKEAYKINLPINAEYYTPHIINTLGVCYRKLNDLDSSNLYFNQLKLYAKKENNKQWLGISSGNIGYNLSLKGKYEEAISLIKDGVKIGKQFKDWGLVTSELINLGELYLKINKNEEAEKIARELQLLMLTTRNLKQLEKYFPFMAKVSALYGDAAVTNSYIDSTIIYKERVKGEFNAKKIARTEQKLQMEEQAAKERYKEQEHERDTLIRNTIITILILVLIIALLAYKNYRNKVKNHQKLIEEKKNTALVELQSFKNLVISKNEIIEDLERKWKNLDANSVIDESQIVILNQLRKATILTPEDWKDFTDSFLKVYPYFLEKLNEKYPNLTPAEIRYLSLTKLKLSNQEMASTLGVSKDAIRKMKSRLKKKINFSDKETPENIVESIH